MKIANFMDVPARQLFACFAESMLEFEKLYTNFSWGRNQITVEKWIKLVVSVKHGFQPLLV